MMMGVADIPIEALRNIGSGTQTLKKELKEARAKGKERKSTSNTTLPLSATSSQSQISLARTPHELKEELVSPRQSIDSTASSVRYDPSGAPDTDASTITSSGPPTPNAPVENTKLQLVSSMSSSNSGSASFVASPVLLTPSEESSVSYPSAPESRGSGPIPPAIARERQPRSSSMAEALRSLSDASRPHSPSRARSRSRSQARSSSTTTPHDQHCQVPSNASEHLLDTAYGTGKGISKIIGAGLKSPMDFTMALSKGFHNIPRLYGEEPRPIDKVTGIKSGIRAAGKVTCFSILVVQY
jgi:hypothetical protein